MNIIFLDIDGVLNSNQYRNKIGTNLWEHDENQFDPIAIGYLNQITTALDAKIVLSSTWRISYENRMADFHALLKRKALLLNVLGQL